MSFPLLKAVKGSHPTMLVKILSCLGRRPSTVAHVPDGRRFYAIGDIHGHLDLLDGLLTRIRDDELERGQPKGELIFLGDLINRGPRSAQVIDRLSTAEQKPATVAE